MREIIDVLNRRGYITIMCCEGHDPCYKGYILFTHNYDFKNSPPPSFIEYNEKKTMIIFDTRENKELVIAQLLEWANELPKRRKKTEYNYSVIGISKRTNQKKILYYGNKRCKDKSIFEKRYYNIVENKIKGAEY